MRYGCYEGCWDVSSTAFLLHPKIVLAKYADRYLSRVSYRTDQPFARLLNDAMCLPLFDGGNIGIRRRQIEKTFQMDGYDPLSAF